MAAKSVRLRGNFTGGHLSTRAEEGEFTAKTTWHGLMETAEVKGHAAEKCKKNPKKQAIFFSAQIRVGVLLHYNNPVQW